MLSLLRRDRVVDCEGCDASCPHTAGSVRDTNERGGGRGVMPGRVQVAARRRSRLARGLDHVCSGSATGRPDLLHTRCLAPSGRVLPMTAAAPVLRGWRS